MVEPVSFLSAALYIGTSRGAGRGVFTNHDLPKDEIIEVSPAIVMSKQDRIHIDQTLLHDYIFEWGAKREQCCLALGYVSVYNHSYASNCEYEMNFRKKLIAIRTVRDIVAGEELFINYNGEWNNSKKVWFDVR